jgi:hypothetical protein
MPEDLGYSPSEAFARDLLTFTLRSGAVNRWRRVHGYTVDCALGQVVPEGVDVHTGHGGSAWMSRPGPGELPVTTTAAGPGSASLVLATAIQPCAQPGGRSATTWRCCTYSSGSSGIDAQPVRTVDVAPLGRRGAPRAAGVPGR